jgi:signal transduction histidine kinase
LLSVSIIPIFIIGVIIYYEDERILTEHTLNNLKFFVSKEKENISNVINFYSAGLDLLSNRIELLQSIEDFKNFQTVENQEKINAVMKILKDVFVDADRISITDFSGKILASTKSTEINKNQSYDIFNKTKNSEQTKINFILTNEDQQTILFSKVLMIGANQIGIVFVEFKQNKIFGEINENMLGETGKFLIAEKISEDSALQIYPITMKKTISMEKNNIPIVQALMKNEDHFSNLVNLENEPVLAATGYIEEANWGIAASVGKSEISTLLQFSLLVVSFVLIIMSIAVVLIAIFFANTIAKPIMRIVNVSNQISQGNLDVKLDIKTNDELNALSNSFNDMIESLKKKIMIEEELEDSKNQLKMERINTIGMLAAQIAHDIKNPLQTIKNSAEIIKNKPLSIEVITREIDRINRGASRISHQVDDVLNYISTTQIDFTQGSILKILQSTIETLKIPETINIILPNNDILVDCDADKIESVFNNILLNAIHAIGNEAGQIKIRLSQEQNKAIIEFENSGSNIPKDVLLKIFEPLFSTKEKGTGLGIVSCKNIIERHGGTITASSDPVVFRILIPIKHNHTK